MTEFSKIKIPFALALLAALFAIKPIIDDYKTSYFLIFELPIKISFIYMIFCLLLGSSVYFYAIGLIKENTIFEVANKIGHITYTLALITPPLFLLLYLITLIAASAVEIWKTPAIRNGIETGFSVMLGVVLTTIVNFIIHAFFQRDKSEKIERLTNQENIFLARAKQFIQQGYYDLAVSESWKAIEIALDKFLVSIGEKQKYGNIRLLLEVVRKHEILNSSQIQELMSIHQARNEAIHTDKRLTYTEAQNAINVSEKAIANLQKAGDRCYFCGRTFTINKLETDNATGASVCHDCGKKHPSWKEELLAIGMDP